MSIITAALVFSIQQGISGFAMSKSKMDQSVAEWKGKCATLKDLKNQIAALYDAIRIATKTQATADQARDAQKRFESNVASTKNALALKQKHFEENIAVMTIGCIFVTAIVVIIISVRASKLEKVLDKINNLNVDG